MSVAIPTLTDAPLPSPFQQRASWRRLVTSTTLLVGVIVALVVALVDDLHIGTDIGLRADPYRSGLTVVPGSAAARVLPVDSAVLLSIEGERLWNRQRFGAGDDGGAIVHASNGVVIATRHHDGPVHVTVRARNDTAPAVDVAIAVDGPLAIGRANSGRPIVLPMLLVVVVLALVLGAIAGARFTPTTDATLAVHRRRRALLLSAAIWPIVVVLIVQTAIALRLVYELDQMFSHAPDPHSSSDTWINGALFVVGALPTLLVVLWRVRRAKIRAASVDPLLQ